MKRFAGSMLAIALLALLPRCVDTSALDFVPVDAGVADATSPACVSCMTGEDGPCWSAYEPCSKIPACVAVMQCLIDLGCLTRALGVDRVTCGLPCLDEQDGGFGAEDPTIQALLQINSCALQSCTGVCVAE
jgi:hypothetical protein